MNDNWKRYPKPPAEGTAICASSNVPEGGTYSIEVDGFPVLLARDNERLVAYVNACPHQFLPLDHRSSSVLSSDGRILRCTNHQAGFDLATGQGVDGFGAGCALDPIPIRENGDGNVVVDEG
ncbi:Rieske (2Fe-2S) protein [Chelativorans salis]|uniref:Rieske (2Fe-2S) protein n=1 Tax=Chelativorans salis TaxID=2978478 RepID=A0ABT2LV91_9HYPH|nr:Rieske (2Fe-2S) protein [Chelativorans sp. EGI FJ00035]MCT7378301.1 Rieske (2Fe-2S) protein [Chelativorans sp. EGI FJ00035]